MICLNCGNCCLKMPPPHLGTPCQHLVEDDGFHFCNNYINRPEECANHDYPYNVCPIGKEKLKIETREDIKRRVESFYSIIRWTDVI